MSSWHSALVSDTDKTIIEQAVLEAEKKTDAEIVPMVVRRSCSGHEVDRGILGGALIGFAVGILCEQFFHLALPVYAIAGAVFGFLLTRFAPIARLCVTRAERESESELRAELEFYRQKVASTKDGIGILIFVSAFDRQVVVLADQAISKVLPESTWQNACETVIRGLKNRSFGAAMAQAIGEIGALCAAHFPPKPVNVDELANHLVIKD
jgi:putative membrane protein